MNGGMMDSCFTHRFIKAVLFALACCRCSGVQGIIVPSGKVGPITPYRSTPRPQADPSRPIREPAPVVEYSPENPEPAPLDPSYLPQSYDTLQALSGNSIFYIPLRIKNVYGFKSEVNRVQDHGPQDLTWRGNYYSMGGPVRAKVTVPIYQVDYSFPESERYHQQKMRPIVVAPLPTNTAPQRFYRDEAKPKKLTAAGDRPYPKKYWNPNTVTSDKPHLHQHYFYVKHDSQAKTNR